MSAADGTWCRLSPPAGFCTAAGQRFSWEKTRLSRYGETFKSPAGEHSATA
ncbi:hypothetical protein AB0K21_28400 [Streptosporangium sp. NPDC049248]|uniref:hypothetical protein n=1 Tax=Streptosporangium sp. NPDC049248 TaxID=3155651 RepID=UPI0034387721